MYIVKLTSENFISKGGRIFEISPTIWIEYVHAGRTNPKERVKGIFKQSEKNYHGNASQIQIWGIHEEADIFLHLTASL